MNETHGGELPRTSEGYEGFRVYDLHHAKVGKVSDAFSEGEGRPTEYIGLKMGFFGSKSALIPAEAVRVNEERRLLQVAMDKEDIKAGPAYDDPKEVTPRFENSVLAYYEVDRLGPVEEDLGPDVMSHEDESREVRGSGERIKSFDEERREPSEVFDGEKELSRGEGSEENENDGRDRVRIHRLQR
jgi:hypothetical protein